MALFRDMLGSGESLFRNEIALDYSFIPKLVPYRESEQRQVAACIKPLFQQRSGRNLFICGSPGIGKTVACRHVLNEIEEQTDDIIPVYVNCWQHNSSFKVFLEMCNVIGYKFTQNKRSDELFMVIKQMLNKKAAVFVFDEIDKLQDYDFLYMVLEEVYKKAIITITNDRNWLASLDSRIRSRLMPESCEFKPYNSEETKGILKQRMEYAFVPGSWDDDAFAVVAEKAFEMQDIRRGLFLMRQAALHAEERASRKVAKEHVLHALGSLDDFSASGKDSSGLEEEDRLMLDIIRKNSGQKIGDLYRAYQEAGGKAVYRTFQRRIDRFEKDRYVVLDRVSGGAEGKTTIVSIVGDKKLTEF
ncbi:AAA family ATPase [Candidatus Woesearchaeota archaeon]|nr:AAA family ATPase [Candidatus Woesearchaeota archaeon]